MVAFPRLRFEWRFSSLRALALSCAVLAAPHALADVEVSDVARRHFAAGVNYLQDPDGARYEDAYREFKAAYADSPSWKILGNLGLTAMKLERDGEAIQAYREYLRQGGTEIEAEERSQIERDLATLEASVVNVTLEAVPAGATITDERISVQGRRVTNVYGPVTEPLTIGIRAGRHRLTASLAGHEDAVWEFEARAGANETHRFELKPKAAATPATTTPSPTSPAPMGDVREARPIPVSVYIGLAATGALAAGGTVTGILATSKKQDFDDANDGTNPARAKDLRDSGQTLNVVTDVLLGGAVVAAGVTAVLYFTRPIQREQAISFTPHVGSDRAGFSLSGHF